MALSSTTRPALRGRMIARIPASLDAEGGLEWLKVNGRWKLRPNFSLLNVVSVLESPEVKQFWAFDPTTNEYVVISVQALVDSLPAGPAGADGSLIFVQDDEPDTENPEGSIWIDSNSSNYDVYNLTSGAWADTGMNLKGDTGNAGADGESPEVFVQNSAPATTGPEGSLWIDADSAQNDLYQLQSGSWVDTGVNLKGADGLGTGDVTSNDDESVDGEIALFNSTTGKQIKRATGSGIAKLTSGVLGTATSGDGDAIVSDASTSTAGKTRLATNGETATGSAADLAVSPAGAAAVYQKIKVTLKTVATTTYTLIADDAGVRIVFTHASGCAVTVPKDVFTGGSGSGDTDQIELVHRAGGDVALVEGPGVSIESEDSKKKLSKFGAAATLTLMYDNVSSTDYFHLAGSLKS